MNKTQKELLKGLNVTILDSLAGYLLLKENGQETNYSIMDPSGSCPLTTGSEDTANKGWKIVMGGVR